MKTFILIMPSGPFLKGHNHSDLTHHLEYNKLFSSVHEHACLWGKQTLTWIFKTGIIRENNLLGKIKEGRRDFPESPLTFKAVANPEPLCWASNTVLQESLLNLQHRLFSEAQPCSLIVYPLSSDMVLTQEIQYSTDIQGISTMCDGDALVGSLLGKTERKEINLRHVWEVKSVGPSDWLGDWITSVGCAARASGEKETEDVGKRLRNLWSRLLREEKRRRQKHL